MKYFDQERQQATLNYLATIPSEFHKVVVNGIELVVFPQVFSPKYFLDPAYFAQHVPVRAGESFLEVGTGTGIMAVIAAIKGAKVTAVDINPYALLNAQYNALEHGVTIDVLRSDVYENVYSVFDTIYSNPPWGCIREQPAGWLQTALWDREYEMTSRLIKGAREHLIDQGRLVIGFSSTIGDLDYLQNALVHAGFHTNIIHRYQSRAVDFEATFEVIEARLSKSKK